MRKIAFRIMAKTFGAKSRDTNEALYDSYPLRDLVELLCFEDTDEARAACKHYNITVEETNVRTPNDDRGSIEEIVFWRRSSFKEPKDKEKGFALPLRPKKMVKTIESKLQGATRLAVCRGDVSGEGASLSDNQIPKLPSTTNSSEGVLLSPEQQKFAAEEATRMSQERAAALRKMKKEEQKRLELAARKEREEEEAHHHQVELKRQLAEQKRLAEIERQKQAEKERLKKEKLEKERIQREAKLQRQREIQEQERLLREQQEKEKLAAKKKAEEERRRKVLEIERLRREQEEAERLEAEKRCREEEERKRKEEEERRREQQQRLEEEEARRRRDEEIARLEAIRLMEEKRRRKVAEESRLNKEWKNRINTARKELILRRWFRRFPRHLQIIEQTEESLQRMDPAIFSTSVAPFCCRSAPVFSFCNLRSVLGTMFSKISPGKKTYCFGYFISRCSPHQIRARSRLLRNNLSCISSWHSRNISSFAPDRRRSKTSGRDP